MQGHPRASAPKSQLFRPVCSFFSLLAVSSPQGPALPLGIPARQQRLRVFSGGELFSFSNWYLDKQDLKDGAVLCSQGKGPTYGVAGPVPFPISSKFTFRSEPTLGSLLIESLVVPVSTPCWDR